MNPELANALMGFMNSPEANAVARRGPCCRGKCGGCSGGCSGGCANCPNKGKCGGCSGGCSGDCANCPNKGKCGGCSGGCSGDCANCPNKGKCGGCSGGCSGDCANCPNKGKCGASGGGCSGDCANCPNKGKCGASGGGCSGDCANCPNRGQCGAAGATRPKTCFARGECPTCPHRSSCGFQTPVSGCPGTSSPSAGTAAVCSTCPNHRFCAAQASLSSSSSSSSTCFSSGACATCPNRDKCGFRGTPAPSCPGTGAADAGSAPACANCPNRDFCRSRGGRAAVPDADTLAIRRKLSQIRHTVVVLSGKGGVGKSTFSAQLAFALAQHQLTDAERAEQKAAVERIKAAIRAADNMEEEDEEIEMDPELAAEDVWQVGLMDIDICGPSIPTMLGIEEEGLHGTAAGIDPAYVTDNLAAVSVGFLLDDPAEAVVWRGPKKNGLITQFLRDVDWGDRGLDWLVVDTPPGTSDEHLTVVRHLAGYADGAVVVTTPQEVALADVRREIAFCRKVGLPVLGVVENMSGFVCPCCHKPSTVFPKSTGGAETMCKEMGVPFLGRIPLDPLIAQACDEGKPYFVAHPEAEATKNFFALFDDLLSKLQSSIGSV